MRKGNLLPLFALVALSLFIVAGVMISGASLQSIDAETNYTTDNLTYTPYTIEVAWWWGIAAIVMLVALVFALMTFLK